MNKFLTYLMTFLLSLTHFSLALAQESKGSQFGHSIGTMAGGLAGLAAGNAVMNHMGGEKSSAKCSSANGIACMMATMFFMQAGSSLASALLAKKTSNQVGGAGAGGLNEDWDRDIKTGDGNGGNSGDKTNPYSPYPSEEAFKSALDKSIADLAKKGFVIDPKNKTFTDPSGKTHPASTLASGQAMQQAGLIKAEEITLIDDAIKKINSSGARMVAVGISGGGGGGGSSSKTKFEYEDPYEKYNRLMNAEKPNAPKTEGLTRTLASGESIGSQTDNIFNMIRRRYEKKKTEYIFVGDK